MGNGMLSSHGRSLRSQRIDLLCDASASSQSAFQSLKRAGVSKSCIMARNDSGYTSNEIADFIENS